MEKFEKKSGTYCTKEMPEEFLESLQNFKEEFRDFLTPEASEYFIEQIEALEEIDKLEESAREHAHSLLTVRDKETSDFKYTPREVLDFVISEGD